MKPLITIILLGFSANMLFAQWNLQDTPTTSQLRGLYFINADTGIAVGHEGVIITTFDGGITWNQRYSGVYDILADVYMVGDGIGYAVGNDGVILKTSDYGITWSSINSNTTSSLRGVHFINDSIGYYVGQSQIIGWTIDGGMNWIIQDYGDYYLRQVYFLNNTVGYCVGDGGNIHKTTNGGFSWSSLNSGVNENLYDVIFLTSDSGYACGLNGLVLKTIDGGITWYILNTGTNINLMSLFFFNTNQGYIVGEQGLILYTNDGGSTWDIENSSLNESFRRIMFLDENTGYIAGTNGTILKKCIPPEAGFSYSINNLTVSFVDTSSSGISFWWDFGDGFYSSLQNPVHTYLSPGTYFICLTIADSCSSDSSCKNINIPVVGINEAEHEGNINIYPNPNNGSFVIKNPDNFELTQIKIIDQFGKTLYINALGFNNPEVVINAKLNPGLYYLEIMSHKDRILKKIVVI